MIDIWALVTFVEKTDGNDPPAAEDLCIDFVLADER